METSSKIFLVKKQSATLVDFFNKEDNTHQYIDYFKFESLIIKTFGFDKAFKILAYINESKSLIIDFENCKALLIKDQNINWNNTFKDFMSVEKVFQSYRKDVIQDIPSFLQEIEDETVGYIQY